MSPGRRNPQIALRLEGSEPDPAARWHDGALLTYLGGELRLVLGTAHGEAVREGDALALPLPPQATPRQIQDRAEAWLREEAKRVLQQVIAQKSAILSLDPSPAWEREANGTSLPSGRERRAPRLALSFAARGHWVEAQANDTLRCNWRLIEQALPVIEQAIARAIAALPREDREFDLFGATVAKPVASPVARPAAHPTT